MAGTGLEVKQPADDPTGTGLAVNSQPMKWPALCLEMEVGGGSAVVLATQKAGSDLPYGLPPNPSPLPVSVHTHSLNLSKLNLAPTYFFVFIFIFIFTSLTIIPSPNPLYRLCSANLSCLLAYPQPLRSLPGGE